MPCFKGLAVSIHTPDGPLPEHSIQKQTRLSRINSYIPVPPPRISATSNRAESSTFAISITLLTPGLSVPYSTPKPTTDEPFPTPQLVGGLPTLGRERGQYIGSIGPYEPLTSSPNETIAAYIYFDGRQKEEVATLLRRGEETWVNSRWVGIPESEGGGLAEREFLFREVGLERWLNGLDLEGKDVAATIQKRRQKMEKRRRKRKSTPSGSDEDDGPSQWRSRRIKNKSVLRYGEDSSAPLQGLSEDEEMESSSEDDSDDDPIPEATGQIKVALFRVLASGEIKKGEYSPQFDAHDDDEDSTKEGEGESGQASVDHTTSFAKPKTLDPKSISTQTVTGIDGPDKPYAVFTFLYRGQKQLQKMGILKPKKSASNQTEPQPVRKKSVQAGIEGLKPLKAGAAAHFTGIRDEQSPLDKNGKSKSPDDMDSDDEPNADDKQAEQDDEDLKNNLLSPEDAKKQGEISEGVRKIRLKRQHSIEPPTSTSTEHNSSTAGKSPKIAGASPADDSPQILSSAAYDPSVESKSSFDPDLIGSPLKKQRASLTGVDSELRRSSVDALARGLGFGHSAPPLKGTSDLGPDTLARGLGFGYSGPPLKSSSDLGADTGFGGALAESSEDAVNTEKPDNPPIKREDGEEMKDA